MKKYLIAGLLLPLWAATLSAASSEKSPEDVLKGAMSDLMRLVYDTPNPEHKSIAEIVRPEIEKYFDPYGMTRRSIGVAWRSFEPEQQGKISNLFVELILSTYLDSFEPTERPKVTFTGTTYRESKKPQCEVDSIVEYEGKRYNVSYRMEKGAGGWKIYDLIGEGVSLVANYRSQFEPIARRGGAEGIIQTLEKTLSDIKSGKNQDTNKK